MGLNEHVKRIQEENETWSRSAVPWEFPVLLLWPLELSVSPRRSSFLCRDFLSPEPFALSCNTIKHGSYNIIHSGPLGGASTGVLTARQSVGSADQSRHSLGAVRRCCGCCRKCWQSVRSATRVVIHSEPVGGASSAVVSARLGIRHPSFRMTERN